MRERGHFKVLWFDSESFEIIQADEYAKFSNEVLAKNSHLVARDGNLLAIRGRTTFACYELIEEIPEHDAVYGRLIKKEGL